MEIALSIIIALMILGAIFALHARDLLSAVIASGIVGYGLVICFLLLKAPDLAIVQIVVETITLIIIFVIAALLISGCEEEGSALIIGSPKECLDDGTYCHLFRVDGGTANITFNMTGNLTYEVAS